MLVAPPRGMRAYHATHWRVELSRWVRADSAWFGTHASLPAGREPVYSATQHPPPPPFACPARPFRWGAHHRTAQGVAWSMQMRLPTLNGSRRERRTPGPTLDGEVRSSMLQDRVLDRAYARSWEDTFQYTPYAGESRPENTTRYAVQRPGVLKPWRLQSHRCARGGDTWRHPGNDLQRGPGPARATLWDEVSVRSHEILPLTRRILITLQTSKIYYR